MIPDLNPIHAIRALAPVACLALGTATVRADDFWVIRDGRAVPLVADATRIAVLAPDPGVVARALGASRGSSADAFPIAGWHIVTVGNDDRAGDVRAVIDAMLTEPGIALATPVFDAPDGPGIVMLTDQILVRFADANDHGAQDAAIAEIPGAILLERDYSGIAGLARIRINARSALDALDASNLFAGRADVEFAEPDFIFTGAHCAIPDDTEFPIQWALLNTGQSGGTPGMDIRATEAFDLEPGDPSTLIVVLDVGVDSAHPDLTLAPGEDFTTDPTPSDGSPVNACDRHGTLVAGCISATINNALGIAGGAGLCRAASARIGISNNPACDGLWTGQLSWTVDALDWALATGAKVTNNSNAYSIGSNAIKNKYEQLRDAGIIHFASAGNSSIPSMAYPASLAAVRAVGAITRTGTLASFSNYGAGLDYTAPGDDILTTDRVGALGLDPGDFVTIDGTSFSSAYAACAGALVATLKPGLTAPQIESVLDRSTTDLGVPGFDTTFGNGLINTRAALELAACVDSWAPTGVSGPSPRVSHAMAFDSARGVSVLFGGLPGAVAVGDTWEHDGSGWTQRFIGGPDPRSGHAMVYDSARGVVVLFGGLVGVTPSSETWEYDGVAWTLRTSSGPPARLGHAMAFDANRGTTVLFGGFVGGIASGETWEWDGTTWSQVAIAGPSPRADAAIAFDIDNDRAVLFGGSTGGSETWTYQGPAGIDPGAWTLAANSGPSSRERAAMAFDTRTSTTVLFGGVTGTNALGDTWEWNGTAWRLRSFFGPVGRSRHTMVCRDDTQDSLTFGGIDNFTLKLGDSWIWFLPAPSVTDPPDGAQASPGETVVLTAEADGVGLLSHQWRKDGADLIDGGDISGAATDTLTIANAQVSDSGDYSVRIWDPCGATISIDATVSVGCVGDVNGDGFTSVGDFNIVAGNFGDGPGAIRAQGDLTGDGFINVADFNILAGDFGCVAE